MDCVEGEEMVKPEHLKHLKEGCGRWAPRRKAAEALAALRHSFLQTLQPSSDVADGVSPVSQPRFVPDADFKLLSDRVEDFVVEHAADTQVQDALWRKQIARQLFVMDCKLTSLASLAKEMQTFGKLKRHRQ